MICSSYTFSILHLLNKKPSSVLNTAIILFFFSGEWTQILAVFSSRGNVNALLLSKLLLEATIMAEKCGLQDDYWTSDGAPWNRSLSKLLGKRVVCLIPYIFIKLFILCLPAFVYIIFSLVAASSAEITCKASYPVDAARHLHMISNFHLVKCVRNNFVSKGLQIPQVHVHVGSIQKAWKNDSETVTLKVMPHTRAHEQPKAFVKMWVNLAFQLFSKEVLKGLFFYKSNLQKKFHTFEPTEHFVRLM